jgi:hypothetical protein
MRCADCRAPVIGFNIPNHLRSSGRCRICYPAYHAAQQLVNNATLSAEQELEKVEEQKAKDNEIDSRFDILDF